MFSCFRLMSMMLVAFVALSLTSLAWAIEIECPIVADTVLCGHSSEKDLNCGGRGSLRVKGYQGIVVFRFDMSPAQGLTIEGGTLSVFCVSISGQAEGQTTSEAISTIAHDWIEGTGDYDQSEDSATFLWPGGAAGDAWGDQNNDGLNRYGEVDALDVINGFGGSISNSQGVWDFVTEEWTDIELDAELVQGLVDGSQYGIVVWRDTTGVNLDLASREWQDGANAPKLTVQAAGASAVSPAHKAASTWGALKSIR